MEGFLPFCRLDEKPQEDAKSLFREGGLPYVSDPAVTRHLAQFLTSAQSPAPAVADGFADHAAHGSFRRVGQFGDRRDRPAVFVLQR